MSRKANPARIGAFVVGAPQQFALDAVVLQGDEGVATPKTNGFDQGDHHLIGDVDGLNEDVFTGLDAGGVAREERGELIVSGIVHALGGLSLR